ncbi:MAG: hypothetical protein JWQ23_4531 [Herminiimonas sp.]|jgi:predicted component of type VI protein secretion system|nr:hypothetical protein [Herminiimonas sp.]
MQNFYKAVSACFLATVIAGCGGSSTDNAGTILGAGATKSQSDVSTPSPDVTNPQSPQFLAGTRGE